MRLQMTLNNLHWLTQATLLKPEEMPVPAAKFEEAFGLSWKDALAAGSVYNALDAVSNMIWLTLMFSDITDNLYSSCNVTVIKLLS